MAAGTGNGAPDLHDRPVGELLKQLSNETSLLVKQELDLAKAEMTQKGKQAGKGAGMFGGAGLFGIFAFAALTTTIIAALDTFMVTWLAALIVTVVYAAIAGVLALTGKKEIDHMGAPVPEQTIETVKTTPEAIRR